MWSNAGAGESSSSQRKRRRRPAPAASPIEASPKGGSLPSTAESSGAASPLRRPCRNRKTGSHIRERWRAHENGVSVHMHPVASALLAHRPWQPVRQVVGRSDAVVPGRRRASAGRQYHGTTEQLHLPNLTERHVTPIGVGSRASPHSADVDANWGTAAEDGEGANLAGGQFVDGPCPLSWRTVR